MVFITLGQAFLRGPNGWNYIPNYSPELNTVWFRHINDQISWKQDTVGGGWGEGRNGEGATSGCNPGLPPSFFGGMWWGVGIVYFP